MLDSGGSDQLPRLSLESPRLSIVIPAYNEERRLPKTLARLTAFLATQDYGWEIVVVGNGCTDGTERVVREAVASNPSVRFISLTERGKGIASRVGALQSAGDIIFLCDADLSMPPDHVTAFLKLAETADIVVGSREAAGAHRYQEPWHRHFMGRIFNRLVQMVAVPGIQDTQCGFKAFRRQAAHDLFGQQRLTGFAFDVELLYLARKYGYDVREYGIEWYFDSDTRVRPGVDTIAMVKELFLIRLRDAFGGYRATTAPRPVEQGDVSG